MHLIQCYHERLLQVVSDSYLQREVMPLPVGMQTDIQSRTGSIHSVPSTSMAEWDIVKLTITSSPNKTEVTGMLIAFPTN